MTYYEELGVSPQASDEEIRRAYRQVSRLLHPDLHPNPELRSIAERQMKRINEVHATLCNPLKRREYDERLATEEDAPLELRLVTESSPQSLEKLVPPSMIAGALFGGLLVFTIMLLWPQSSASQAGAVSANQSAAPDHGDRPKTVSGKPTAAVGRQRLAAKPPNEAGVETRALAEPSARGPEAIEEPVAIPSPILVPQVASVPQHPASANPAPFHAEPSSPAASATPTLSGVWIAVRERNEDLGPNDYAAEYVEIRIQQEGNFLRGNLRSKYRIPDRLMNPQVNFRFEGKVDEEEFPWRGEGNAAGRIRLSLNRNNTLHMHWKAESLAPNSQLLEGSGKLLRVQTD